MHLRDSADLNAALGSRSGGRSEHGCGISVTDLDLDLTKLPRSRPTA